MDVQSNITPSLPVIPPEVNGVLGMFPGSSHTSNPKVFETLGHYEPGSTKLPVLGMVIQPLIGNPYNGYINPYGLGLMSLSPIIWK